MPSLVKISSSSACGTRPSSTCARGTPPSTARRHASIFGTMPLASVGSSSGELVGVDLADDLGAVRPVGVEALDVGEHDQLLGAETDGDRGRRGVGVDVVGQPVAAARDGGDDRDPAGVEQREHRRRVDRDDVADLADVDLLAVDDRAAALGGEQAGVLTGQADRERAVVVEQVDDRRR